MDQWLTPPEIERKIVALVASTRQTYNIPSDCMGVEASKRIGLQVQLGSLPLGTDGLLVNECTIVINKELSWQPRIEFTIFHEIVHFLLNEDGDLIEFFTDTLRNDDVAYKAAIERCCHQGAAEFLLPQMRVREAIVSEAFSVHLLEKLATGMAHRLSQRPFNLLFAPPSTVMLPCVASDQYCEQRRPGWDCKLSMRRCHGEENIR
ncbi:MAG: ImmA/IrrE family metallo-endopeptidase [Thermomicrobiales bacterium]